MKVLSLNIVEQHFFYYLRHYKLNEIILRKKNKTINRM